MPGARILLAAAPKTAARRTTFTLTLVRHRGRWVSAVPALANRIFEAALRRRGAPGLVGARVVRREARYGRSRIDFVLESRGRRVLTEIKSVTLVEDERALFPDAPTERGARHLRELAAHCRRRGRALVVFVVQRDDARSVSPHPVNDPAFARAATEAAAAGVRFLAYACRVTPAGVTLERRVPVRLPGRIRV